MKKTRNTERNTRKSQITLSGTTELGRKQWHGPYFSSMRLELIQNRQGCVYEGEYLLNTKPLQIDMLARTEGEVTWIRDEITKGFRRHNIIEFKSPDDVLNLDVFYKTLGYACLYKAQESRVDEISRTDISITFVRERKPEKLLKELNALYDVVQCTPGIYRIGTDKLLFPVQILVLREMEWRQHIWVTALQRQISLEHAKVMVLEMEKLEHPDEREWADSVLQLAMANNKEIFEQLKEERLVYKALRELMADEIEEELQKARVTGMTAGRAEGRAEGKAEERQALLQMMQRLRNGEKAEAIRMSGGDAETLDVAMAALRL